MKRIICFVMRLKSLTLYTESVIWQADNVSIEAGSVIQAGRGGGLGPCSNRSQGLVLEILRYAIRVSTYSI